MTTHNRELPTLITPNATTGLALAVELAAQLRANALETNDRLERPGGTDYLLPAPVAVETIASILFYAIAAANHGWEGTARLSAAS